MNKLYDLIQLGYHNPKEENDSIQDMLVSIDVQNHFTLFLKEKKLCNNNIK